MIERRGQVLTVADGIATVRVELPSTCASCGSRGACTSARTLELPAPPTARPGATVTLALPESDFLRGALLAYGLPAVATLTGAILLSGAGDLAAVAGALCGLGLGLIGLRRFGRRAGCAAPAFVSQPSGDVS
ncbi:MAG: SoxR reducing system RseC family protein [Rhodocyclaceae bacterium]|jgi:positive regulator of sigma E activity|nr:SoxR reducing system RseC family protein [Rhodocyclaceae bacterium]